MQRDRGLNVNCMIARVEVPQCHMGGGSCRIKIKARFIGGYQRDGHPYDKFVIAQWQLLQMAPIPIKGLSILSDYHCLPVDQLADGLVLPPEQL